MHGILAFTLGLAAGFIVAMFVWANGSVEQDKAIVKSGVIKLCDKVYALKEIKP